MIRGSTKTNLLSLFIYLFFEMSHSTFEMNKYHQTKHVVRLFSNFFFESLWSVCRFSTTMYRDRRRKCVAPTKNADGRRGHGRPINFVA